MRNKKSFIVTPITYSQLAFVDLPYGSNIKDLNPLYTSLVYGKRNGKLLYDLRYTLFNLKRGIFVLSAILIQRGKFLFIDNFLEYGEVSKSFNAQYNGFLENFLLMDHYFINSRWIAGFLTNFKYISRHLEIFLHLLKKNMIISNEFNFLRLEFCIGIKLLRRLPSFCFLNTLDRLKWQGLEVSNLKIPSIAMTGSLESSYGLFFPIFGSTNSSFSISFMLDLFFSIIIDVYLNELFIFFKKLFFYYRQKKTRKIRLFKLKRKLKMISIRNKKIKKRKKRKFYVLKKKRNLDYNKRNRKKNHFSRNKYQRQFNRPYDKKKYF